MSFIEQDRAATIARRRRLYGSEINYCSRDLLHPGGYSGVVAGKMWLGLDPEIDFGSTSRRATDIINAVFKVTMIPRNDFFSGRRRQVVTDARQIACFFLRHHTKLSFPQIGELIGGKDHSTVIHAVRAVQRNKRGKFTRRLQAISMVLGLLPPTTSE